MNGGTIGTPILNRDENCRPQDCEEQQVQPQCQPMAETKPRMRAVQIQPLNYGFIVTIGCHSFAIETAEQLISKLSDYIKSPEDTEERWLAGVLF